MENLKLKKIFLLLLSKKRNVVYLLFFYFAISIPECNMATLSNPSK